MLMIKIQMYSLAVLTSLHPKKILAAYRYVAQLQQLLQKNWAECFVMDFHVSLLLCIRMLSVRLQYKKLK